jgi:hypothetical protein
MTLPTKTTRDIDRASDVESLIRAGWRSPELLPGIDPKYGRGFIATASIAAGAVLFELADDRRGPRAGRGRLRGGAPESPDVFNQAGSTESVAPNARFIDSFTVVSTRVIVQGELIRVDFSQDRERVKTNSRLREFALVGSAGVILQFIRGALQQEWSAAVVSFLSAIPSNLLSCVIVVWGADLLSEYKVFSSEAAYISAVSVLTGFVGYATYLLGYYGGMLIKERADLREDGKFSWRFFRRKCRVVWYDFLIHLPSDFYSLPLLSVTQGGMYVAGLPQFWSIFWAQAIADAISAVKEPFFWHGAKKIVEFTERQAANQDRIDRQDELAAND